MRTAAITILTLLLVAFAAPVATAQDPSTRGYDSDSQILGEVGEVQESTPPSEPTSEPAGEPAGEPTASAPASQQSQPVQAESGSLPFTGLEIGVVALLGALLLGTGVAVRRVAGRGDVS